MSKHSFIHWRNGLLVGLIGGVGLYCAAYSWPIILAAGAGIALFSRFLSIKYFPSLKSKNFLEAIVEWGVNFKDFLLILKIRFAPTTVVEAPIARGTGVNVRDVANETLLHQAAEAHRIATMEALIASGVDVKARGDYNRTLLHVAAIKGHTATLKALIAIGAQVDARDNSNETPLHLAAWLRHTETAEALIAQGAEINARDNSNRTPLCLAAGAGHTATAEALIAQGANLHALDNNGECPLSIAARRGHTDTVRRVLAGLSATARQQLLTERGEHIIAAAFENGYDEIVNLLQNCGVRLPARLHHRANRRLNGAQSTHEVSVHESVSQSVLALASCYLPDLSNKEKTVLRAWYDSALNDPQRSRYKKNARKLMEQLLKRPVTQAYIKRYAAELQQFCTNLEEKSCEFAEHNALKVTAAKRALARLLNNTNYRDFTDSRSGVPMNLALALVYQGVWDKNNTHLVAFSEKGRCEILVQALYEMQRGYNLNDDGKEKNASAADGTICVPGHFNKMISALGGGRHEAVNIIFVTNVVALFKVQALLKEHYDKVPQAEQRRYFGEIHSTHKLPAHLWNAYLKEPVLAELYQEYDSFVKAGVLPQTRLNSAIYIAINGALPKYVLEVMLYSARLAEEIDEETQAAIIGRYDLYFKEEPFMLPKYIIQGKQRAKELGVELSSTFCWPERRLMLGSKTHAKVLLENFANKLRQSASPLGALTSNGSTSSELKQLPNVKY